jgi:hypothetical protein
MAQVGKEQGDMTPLLIGRWETRIFVLGTAGAIWTLLISPVLPGIPAGAPLRSVYGVTFQALLIVIVAGFLWDALYQGLMYLRWEKDWPFLFGFLTGINEGISTWLILRVFRSHGEVAVSTFLVLFSTTWIITLLYANSLMRVLFPRWRFRGGMLIGGRVR